MRAGVYAAAVAISLGGCAGDKTMPASAPSALAGKPLPTFSRRTLSGEKLDTKSLVGRVVVVKFFAEYCAPCTKTLPAAQALAAEHPGVAFIGISEDERASTAAELVTRHGLSFPVIHDAGQVLWGRFRVREMPATFVAGKDGIVRWVGDETADEATLRDAIEVAAK